MAITTHQRCSSSPLSCCLPFPRFHTSPSPSPFSMVAQGMVDPRLLPSRPSRGHCHPHSLIHSGEEGPLPCFHSLSMSEGKETQNSFFPFIPFRLLVWPLSFLLCMTFLRGLTFEVPCARPRADMRFLAFPVSLPREGQGASERAWLLFSVSLPFFFLCMDCFPCGTPSLEPLLRGFIHFEASSEPLPCFDFDFGFRIPAFFVSRSFPVTARCDDWR